MAEGTPAELPLHHLYALNDIVTAYCAGAGIPATDEDLNEATHAAAAAILAATASIRVLPIAVGRRSVIA